MHHYEKKAFCLFVIFLLSINLFACDNKNNKLVVIGSSALLPIEQEATNHFYKKGKTIVVLGGGSGQGINSIVEGMCDIGSSDIEIGETKDNFVDNKICIVAIAVVVGKSVDIDNIATNDLIAIYEGKKTNWKQISGSNLDHPINVYYRKEGTGTRTLFELYGLNRTRETLYSDYDYSNLGKHFGRVDSTQEMKIAINRDPYAIGYETMPYLSSDMKKLKIDSVAPLYENIDYNRENKKAYNIWGYEHMYTNKKRVSKLAEEYIAYIKSVDFEKVIKKYGYYPIS